MHRVTITLNEEELRALVAMANADCRHARDELRYIFIEAARERGFLQVSLDEETEKRTRGDAAGE